MHTWIEINLIINFKKFEIEMDREHTVLMYSTANNL